MSTIKSIQEAFLKDTTFNNKWRGIFTDMLSSRKVAEFDTWEHRLTAGSLTLDHLYQKLLDHAKSEHGEDRMLHLLKDTLKKSNCLQIYESIQSCQGQSCSHWFNINSGINPFYGRDKHISKLLRIYYKPTSVDVVTLCGLPGMGKTELVKQFLHNEQIKNKVPCIWIGTDSLPRFKQDLANVAENLLPEIKLDFNKADPGSLLVTIATHIGKSTNQKWILILDGCTADTVEPNILRNLMESKAMVILTCIDRNLYFIHRSYLIDVTELDEESALKFVKYYLKSEFETEASMQQLCKFVNNYPLVLEQVTLYLKYKQIHHVSKETIHDYIDECRTKSGTLISIEFAQFSGSKYGKTIQETLATTIDRVQVQSDTVDGKNKYAFNLLQIIAFLGPDHVDVKFVKKVFTCWESSIDDEVFRDSLNFLKALCFIKCEANNRLQMNTTVQQVVRNLKLIDSQTLYNILIKLETECTTVSELRHFLCIWGHAMEEKGICLMLIGMAPKISNRLDQFCMYSDSLCFAQSAINSFCETENSENSELLLEMKKNYGLALRRLGKGEEAIELFKEIINAYTPSDQPIESILNIQQHLANSYYTIQKFDEALDLYEQVLVGKTRIFGENSRAVNQCQSNIAGALIGKKRFYDAEVKLKGILHWQKKNNKPEDARRVTHSLGYCYYKMKNYLQARIQFEEVLNHPDDQLQANAAKELITRYMLGRTLYHLNDESLALKTLRDVFQQQVVLIGADNQDTLDTKKKIEKYLNQNQRVNPATFGKKLDPEHDMDFSTCNERNSVQDMPTKHLNNEGSTHGELSMQLRDTNDLTLLKINYLEQKSQLTERKRLINARIHNLKLQYNDRKVQLMRKKSTTIGKEQYGKSSQGYTEY